MPFDQGMLDIEPTVIGVNDLGMCLCVSEVSEFDRSVGLVRVGIMTFGRKMLNVLKQY